MARGSTTGTVATSSAPDVLWSFIQGEQQEFGVTLGFLSDIAGYTFEAAVIEGLNTISNDDIPTDVRPSGIHTTINVRVPATRGTWSPGIGYSFNEIVENQGDYWRLKIGNARVSATPPPSDADWELYTNNKIYVQFPKTLGTGWSVVPAPGRSVHGFFDLRVTEPASEFQQTFKPMHGPIELIFSPTEVA